MLRVTLFIIFLIATETYFTWRTLYYLKNILGAGPKVRKITGGIFLFLINLLPVILFVGLAVNWLFGVELERPREMWFSYMVGYPFWFLFILMTQVLLFYIAAEILRLPALLLKGDTKKKINKYISIAALASLFVFIIYLPVRIWYDYTTVGINKYKYIVNDVTPEFEGTRLVLVGDIQADEYTGESRLARFTEEVNSVDPDIIISTGDFITNQAKFIEMSAAAVSRMKAPAGIYSAVGDHDQWARGMSLKASLDSVETALRGAGIEMIEDENRVINVNGEELFFTFVTQTYSTQIDRNRLDSLTTAETNGRIRIFVSHQPDEHLVEKASETGYDIFLAGHTHGGQITLVTPIGMLSPTDFETRYVKGRYELNDLSVFVTRGLGMSIAPFRYNATPGVTVIEFVKGKE